VRTEALKQKAQGIILRTEALKQRAQGIILLRWMENEQFINPVSNLEPRILLARFVNLLDKQRTSVSPDKFARSRVLS
jgi:hypothetical protein